MVRFNKPKRVRFVKPISIKRVQLIRPRDAHQIRGDLLVEDMQRRTTETKVCGDWEPYNKDFRLG